MNSRKKKTTDGRKKKQGMTLSELSVFNFLSSGAKVLRCGWPDFLVLNNGVAYCVEVKAGNDPLTDQQLEMHAALKKIGIHVFIVRDGYCDELQMKFGKYVPVKSSQRRTRRA